MIIKRRGIRPPPGAQIDWGSGLARGMVGCWHLHSPANQQINLCNAGFPGSVTGSPTTDQVGLDGIGCKFADGVYYATGSSASTDPYNFLNEFSVLASFFWPTSGFFTGMPISKVNFSTDGWNVQTDGVTSPVGGLYFYDLEFNTGSFQTASAACLVPGMLNHVLTTFSTSKSIIVFYANGVRYANGGNNAAAIVSATTTARIGDRSSGSGGRAFTSGLSRVVLWNRALTDDEGLLVTNAQTAYAYMQPSILWSVQAPQGGLMGAMCI
jgi:hypothetical protein